jgi:hypothetical protein
MDDSQSLLPELPATVAMCKIARYAVIVALFGSRAAAQTSQQAGNCNEQTAAILYRMPDEAFKKGMLLIDHPAMSGGESDWPSVKLDGIPLESSRCTPVADTDVASIPSDVKEVRIVRSDTVRFTAAVSLRPRADDGGERNTIFAPPMDLSVLPVLKLGGAPEKCSAGIDAQYKVFCATETLRILAPKIDGAYSTARRLQNAARETKRIALPNAKSVDAEGIRDLLDELSDYTLTQSDIEKIASEYSAFPRDVVAPIAEKTWRAVEQTAMIEDGVRRLNDALTRLGSQKDYFSLTTPANSSGATLYVSVRRTLPAYPDEALSSITRVFQVEKPPVPHATTPVPPSPSVPPSPPVQESQPAPTYVIIDGDRLTADGDHRRPEPSLIIAPSILFIPGAHDDSYSAVPSGQTMVVQRTSTRDRSLQPGIAFGYGMPKLTISAELTVVPSSPLDVIALGVSHYAFSSPLRFAFGVAFSRETRLSGMRVGDVVAAPEAVVTSENYRAHAYVSISFDISSFFRR